MYRYMMLGVFEGHVDVRGLTSVSSHACPFPLPRRIRLHDALLVYSTQQSPLAQTACRAEFSGR